MSELAYASRFCSQQTAIPFAELHLRTDEVKEKMKNKPGKIIIKEFPPSTITVPELKGWIKKHIVEKGIKLMHFVSIILIFLMDLAIIYMKNLKELLNIQER